MAAKRRRSLLVRLAAIVAVGAACMMAAALYRRSLRPAAAPAEAQRQGVELVAQILGRVGSSEFGRSRRGRLLTTTLASLVDRGRVVFTAEIASQALYRRELWGRERLYVKVLRLSRGLVQQSTEEIAEGLYHEAVHALRSQHAAASIEEECDGYAAGLCAGAVVAGRTLPQLLTLEGQPLARFVVSRYPELRRDPAYHPVGASPQWLRRRTGLR